MSPVDNDAYSGAAIWATRAPQISTRKEISEAFIDDGAYEFLDRMKGFRSNISQRQKPRKSAVLGSSGQPCTLVLQVGA